MKISELFFSIQGESKGVGEPAVFIRLAKCNLACDFCDTKYALGEEPQVVPAEKVIDRISVYECKNVVITGGEPLLQMGPLTYLCSLLDCQGYSVTIETNGTIMPALPLFDLVRQWNISPKFGHIKFGILKDFIDYCDEGSGYILKFVIEDEEQIADVDEVRSVLNLFKSDIYLMPCAANRSEYLQNVEKVVELCKKHRYNFSPREHIVIWDGKRGV